MFFSTLKMPIAIRHMPIFYNSIYDDDKEHAQYLLILDYVNY